MPLTYSCDFQIVEEKEIYSSPDVYANEKIYPYEFDYDDITDPTFIPRSSDEVTVGNKETITRRVVEDS